MAYAEVLGNLQEHISQNGSWARSHPEQQLFIQQMFLHFVEGPAAVSLDDQISFIKAMCDTGESDRYSYQPQAAAAQEFADTVAERAHRQFDDSRRTLAAVKSSLQNFARTTLLEQVNEVLHEGQLEKAELNFRGLLGWGVGLSRPEPHRTPFLVFVPTAAYLMSIVSELDFEPDYSRVFVGYGVADVLHSGHVVPTDVGLDEVLNGLSRDDVRLRDAVLTLLAR